ncbi:MAG: polysaccharide deacetylase family protein [Frankiales bacterium]|nr:polysaccharide deacetylase family protein [Frankiales bacterium]
MLGKLLLAGGVAAAAVQAAPVTTFLPATKRFWPTLNGQGTPGHVALTFDDGPDEQSTPRFLAVLGALEVRATFFLLGEMCERYPSMAERIVDEGHEVAVHSWDHRNHLRNLPGRRTADQLARTADIIEAQCGVRPSYFRPPYGALTTAALVAARDLGLQTVLWTAWGQDWQRSCTPRSVLEEVTSGVVDGGTILLHDSDCTSEPGSWRASLGALPLLVEWCRSRSLEVGTVGAHGLAA